MKRLILIIALFISLILSAQDKYSSYMIPDIGSPGTNIYIEIIAHVDSLWAFGTDRVVSDNSLYIEPSNSVDAGKIQFSPLYISWSGRLISAQVFIHPDLKPTSWKWSEGIHIPINLIQSGNIVGKYDFYIVQPFHIGNVNASMGFVLGEGNLGIRSPRGAMIIDSMISTSTDTYTVSKNDCDTKIDGNQAYLPFTLISLGTFEVPNINVNADGKNGGVGGGGGGGSYENLLSSVLGDVNNNDYKGGDGFTGGGRGGMNYSVSFSEKGKHSAKGGGIGSGSNDNSGSSNYAGYSLNQVRGAYTQIDIYETAGGGTGHPFGVSGKEYYNNETNNLGGYGGGSGGTDNTTGGNGCYANSTNETSDGKQHGNVFLMPLAGGSGGASGNPHAVEVFNKAGYGGGGGGAISISAPTIKIVNITANGAKGDKFDNGNPFDPDNNSNGGNGSGGAIILNGKLLTQVTNTETSEGSKSVSEAGYVRVTGNGTFNSNLINAKFYKADATDTLKYINPEINTKMKIFMGYDIGELRLYIKSENTAWQEFPILGSGIGTGELEITSTFWNQSTDSIYYLYAVRNIETNDDTNLYAANPKNILTQSAANVFILRTEDENPCENEDVTTTTILCDFDNIHVCYEGEYIEQFHNQVFGNATLLKLELEGTHKDNFSFTSNIIPPAALPVDNTLILNIKYNIGENKDTSLGTKTAKINMYLRNENRECILIIYELNYEIVNTFLVDTLLDFGDVPIDEIDDTTLIAKYLPTKLDIIDTAFLKVNDGYFLFNSNIIKTNLVEGKLLPINISYNALTTGIHKDTLCIVVDNDFCLDTTYIPIQMNVIGNIEYDTMRLGGMHIAICGDTTSYGYVQRSYIGDTVVTASEPIYQGTGIDFKCIVGDNNYPIVLDDGNNNGFFPFMKSIGKDTGDKVITITFDIHRKNGNLLKLTIISSIKVVVPVSISPLSIDFGTISATSNVTMPVYLTNNLTIKPTDFKIYSSRLINNIFSIIEPFNPLSVSIDNPNTATIGLINNQLYGVLEDTLEVVIEYNECYDTLKVPVTATIIENPVFSLRILDYPNVDPRTKDFPISVYIKCNEDFPGGTIENMSVCFGDKLRGALFMPKTVSNGNITDIYNGIANVTIANIEIPPLQANKEELLLNITGDVLLGDTNFNILDICAITIGNSIDYDEVMLTSGSLSIEICKEGDDRLLKTTSNKIESQYVNPLTTDNIEVKCEINSNGNYYLEIIDNAGNSTLLKSWNVYSLEKTEYNFTLDLSTFANGNYYLRLRNELEQSFRKLIISR